VYVYDNTNLIWNNYPAAAAAAAAVTFTADVLTSLVTVLSMSDCEADWMLYRQRNGTIQNHDLVHTVNQNNINNVQPG